MLVLLHTMHVCGGSAMDLLNEAANLAEDARLRRRRTLTHMSMAVYCCMWQLLKKGWGGCQP